MENSSTTDRLIRQIASKCRVLSLGGLAVISHGLSRNTHDADIWVDPMESASKWASIIGPMVYATPNAKPVAIAVWTPISQAEFESVVSRDGVFRIIGLDRPLDIFREPNELPTEEFEAAWQRAVELKDGTRLPDEIDLLMTKQLTDRAKDVLDIGFLENKAEVRYLAEIPLASEELALGMLERFLTPKVAETAIAHTSAAVREIGFRFLRELADEGDPFAAEILKKLST